MPLHLLGKKSWNVYNSANIARVRRDEAAARAKEEAEEQRMQEADAARRLAILRGEVPPPLEAAEEPNALPTPSRHHRHDGTGRKRKRHGEDDTDFEMRLAQERASAGDRAARELTAPKPPPSSSSSSSAPPVSLVDSKGHISLFSALQPVPPAEKNEEAEREAARKKRELQDQYQMRLVNAAGRDGQGLTDGGPWYASGEGEVSGALVPSTNVWGREDPKRKDREAKRLGASDPLSMMKKGAAKVREERRERKRRRGDRGDSRDRHDRSERERSGRGRSEREWSERERPERRERSDRQRGDGIERHRDRSKERDRRRHKDGHENRRHTDGDKHHRSSHRSDQDRDRHKSSH